MIEIFNGSVYDFGSVSSIWATISYEKKRNGADMQYRFNYKIRLSNRSGGTASSATYQNNVQAKFYLNNVNVYTKSVKSSSINWSFEYTTEWFNVEDKTTGTVPFKFTIKDTQNSSWCNYSSSTYELEINPAGSDFKTLSNFNIGQPFTLTINKYNEDFYDKLVIKIDSKTIKAINDIGTSTQVEFTDSELDTIYGLTKEVQYSDFTFEISSFEDEEMTTQIGKTNTKAVKGYIIASNPIISSKSAVDTNTTTIALTGDNTKLIKAYSNVKVSIKATAQNQATIKSVTINGITATLTNGAYVVSFNKTTVNTFNIVITDSRGFQTTDSITLDMINYIDITLSVSAVRNQPTDNKVKINYSGNYYKDNFGATENTLTVQYRFKEKGQDFTDADEWINMSPTISDNNTFQQSNFIVEEVDYKKVYEFQFYAFDRLTEWPITTIVVKKGKPTVHVGTDFCNINGSSKITDNLNVNNDIKAGSLSVTNNISYGKYFTQDLSDAFKTSIFGNGNSRTSFKPIRNNSFVSETFPRNCAGFCWSMGDTHGFIITHYNNPDVIVGGGNKDVLNWTKHLAFMDNAIVESSFGTNSSYVKFGNGLMITMQTVTENVAITTSAAGWYGGTFPDITFPAEFIEAPYPSISVVGGTLVSVSRIEEITATQLVGLRLVRGSSHTANITLKIMAIGRWK